MPLHVNSNSEKILSSIDQLSPAKAPDYFYARLAGRLQRDFSEERIFFLMRPAFLIVGFIVLLVFNLFVISNSLQNTLKQSRSEGGMVASSSVANELNFPTLLYDEK